MRNCAIIHPLHLELETALIKKDALAFVRFEGSLYPDGPTWIIEQISPRVKDGH